MDALDKVKEEVRKRRREQRKQAEGEERARRRQVSGAEARVPAKRSPGLTHPRLSRPLQALVGGSVPLGHALSTSTAASDQRGARRGRGAGGAQGGVDLRELGWEERERVLRLLFAKMNSVHGYTDALPSHALEGQGEWRGEEGAGDTTVPHVFVTEGTDGGARAEDDQGADPHGRVGPRGGRWGHPRAVEGAEEGGGGEEEEVQGRLPRGHVAGNAVAAAAALGDAPAGTGAAKQLPRMA